MTGRRPCVCLRPLRIIVASRASGRRHPCRCQKKAAKATALAFAGHAATPWQTPSPRLPDFVPEGQGAVKKILIFFSGLWGLLYPCPIHCWIKSGRWLESSDLATTRSAPACSACWRASTATCDPNARIDRKSTRLNSSHLVISYAVFCLKKKKNPVRRLTDRDKRKLYNRIT